MKRSKFIQYTTIRKLVFKTLILFMKLRPIVSSLIAASLLLASTHPVDAQKKRPAGVASLAEMSCQSLKGEYSARNEDISVGLEIFRAVGFFAGVITGEPAKIVCRLAQPKEKPKYKTLTLAFGLHDGQAGSDLARLTLYKDGKEYDYKDISRGEKLLWQADVSGTRSIALEVECLKGHKVWVNSDATGCVGIYFFEDTLK